MGLEAEAAEAQAFLFYCFVFGESLLFLQRGQRKRAQLVAKSAKTRLDGCKKNQKLNFSSG